MPKATDVRDIAAAELDDAALAALFTLAYEGYPVPLHVDADAVRFMNRSFDFDREASRVIVAEGEPVALAMLGHRGRHGWVGGMGVVAGARRHGYGRRVMGLVIERARALGIVDLDLEVLTQNREAIPLYESLGFVRTRGLGVWRIAPPPMPEGATIERVSLDEGRAIVRRLRRAPEPWQRADATLDRFLEQGLVLEVNCVRVGTRELGAVVYRHAPPRVSVLQLGVEPGEEARGVTALLASLARNDAPDGVRWLNLPEPDPATTVVCDLVPTLEASQHEMRLRLDPSHRTT